MNIYHLMKKNKNLDDVYLTKEELSKVNEFYQYLIEGLNESEISDKNLVKPIIKMDLNRGDST